MSLIPEPSKQLSNPSVETSGWPLIGPGDPAPYDIFNADGDAPFLLVCDHASRAIPHRLKQLGLADWVLDQHVACDIGARTLTLELAQRFNAPAVLAGYSRLVVDLNRQLHDASAFPEVSDGIAIPGNMDLSETEREARIASFFTPYHDAVSTQLARFTERGAVPALLSIHTCTPIFNEMVRRWHVGIMWDKDPRIAQPLLKNLNTIDDLCVGDNEPYSGAHPNDYTVDVHAEREGFPCIGVEFRQDLVDSPEGARHWAELFGDAIAPILAEPSLYRRLDG